MIRKIIHIDEEKCDGCGLCAKACHEGAIGMVGGKARLLRDDYCDGLGDCLPACPTGAISFVNREAAAYDKAAVLENNAAPATSSQLRQWPVQIKLAPGTAYAYGSFHQDFIRGKVTLIGCPKLDEGDYTEKLTEIIRTNTIKSLTVTRMEVPCCGGIERAAVTALKNSGKFIPWKVVTISADGRILDKF